MEIGTELGRNNNPITLGSVVGDVIADDLLGMAQVVAIGGIDEVSIPVEVAVDNLLGFLNGRPPPSFKAEGHAT